MKLDFFPSPSDLDIKFDAADMCAYYTQAKPESGHVFRLLHHHDNFQIQALLTTDPLDIIYNYRGGWLQQYDAGVIGKKQEKYIVFIVMVTDYKHFLPA